MKSSNNALAIITPTCFFASLDLKDPYYSVKIYHYYDYTKLTKFSFMASYMLYKFLVLPQLFRDSQNLQISKPILLHLRLLSYEIVMCIDDSLRNGDSKEMCAKIDDDSYRLIDSLGFTTHQNLWFTLLNLQKKLILFQTQEL